MSSPSCSVMIRGAIKRVPCNDLLVICDGADMVCEVLKDKNDSHLNITYKEAGDDRTDKFPDNWEKGNFRILKASKDLVGFGAEVGNEILTGKIPTPAVVIAAERGAQISLNVLIRGYWRGPFVCVGSGVLESKTLLTINS